MYDQLPARDNWMRGLRRAYPLLLLLAPFIFFAPGTRMEILLGDGDAFVQFLPFWKWAADQWSQWTPPFWTPDIFSGFPLLAEPQAAVFHPLKLLFVFLPPVAAMNLTVLLYYGVAGLFTYLLAREEGLQPEAGLLAGVAFAFSGFLIGHQAITALFITAASFPVLFYALRRTVRKSDYGSILLGMLAILSLVLAGHPQFIFFALFFALFYAAYLWLFVVIREQRGPFLRCVGAIYFLGCMLGAFQFLPTLELKMRSLRDSLSYADFVGLSLPLHTLFTSLLSTRIYHLFPNDASEAMLDVGFLVLLLALVGALKAWRGAAFWIFLFLFGALLFLGDNTPLYRLMYHVPGYNLFRLASRNGIAVDFAVALLAGYGLNAVQAGRRTRGWMPAVLLLMAPLVYLIVFVPAEQRIHGKLFFLAEGGTLPWSWEGIRTYIPPIAPELLLMLAGGAALLWILFKGSGRVSVAFIFIALALTHFWEYRNWIFAAPASQVEASLKATPLIAELAQSGRSGYRVALGGPANWMNFLQKDRENWRAHFVRSGGVDVNMLHSIPSISGYSPLILRNYSRLAGNMHMSGVISDAGFFASPALNLLNVRHVVVSEDGLSFPKETFSRFRIVWRDGKITLYENRDSYGLFWGVRELRLASDEEFWREMENPTTDFRTTALLMDTDLKGLCGRTYHLPERVEASIVSPNHIRLEVETAGESFLAGSHLRYPGWFARVDGRWQRPLRVNGIFSGMVLPPGIHTVELRFIPVSFWTGLMVSMLSLGLFSFFRSRDILRLRFR
jgi:hypothetical protein